jgi:murein DD-endopeptidase MepM/ murein hydrolase activator NlpD
MGMAPNTMAAVTQRLAADSYAGMSGMSSRQAILQANRQVGGGATSAMGPTMAQMNIAYSGYTANSLSSRSIMSQLSGLSAQSGMTNEAAAASVAGMNGMMFLRAGIRIRDNNGNLKPVDQIINQVYNFLYRGRQITSEEAQLVYATNSRAYSTIAQLAGNDPNLIQQIQAGIVARTRAKSGKAYSAAMNSKDPNKMLDLMGVDKSSPIRSNFRYQTSEARKLASTEQGLVGGYNTSLRTTAAINDGFSTMADLLGPVNDGLMGLKGILQTMPGAGGTGATISGLAGSAMQLGGAYLGAKYIGGKFGGKGFSSMGGTAGKFGKFGKVGVTGLIASLAGGAIKGNSAHGSARSRAGTAASWAGTASLLNLFGPEIGIPAMLLAGAAGAALGGDTDHGNMGTAGSGASGSSGPYAMPVPRATPITSPFGPRDNSMHPGISKNHHGIDYGMPEGSPVYAAADGVVKEVGTAGAYGTYVLIKHGDGKTTRYAHLKQPLVSRGDHVIAGQKIARSGGKPGSPGAGNSTGPHLHFEMTDKNGVKINPQAILTGASNKHSDAVPSKSMSTGSRPVKNFGEGRRTRSQSSYAGGSLSSPSISSLIGQLTDSNSPISWQDVIKKIPAKDRQKFIESIPDTYTGPVTKNKKDLIRTISNQGFTGKALKTAYAVSIAESGGRSNAMGDIKLQDEKWGPSVGLFQIRSLKDWKKYNDPYRDVKRLPNPSYNAQAAFKKSKGGNNWNPWTTYTHGTFLKHLAEADSMAKQAGVGGPVEGVNLPSGFSGNSGGSATNTMVIAGGKSGTVNINLNMNVTIAQGSVQEAERIVRLVGQRLKEDVVLKQIAGSL